MHTGKPNISFNTKLSFGQINQTLSPFSIKPHNQTASPHLSQSGGFSPNRTNTQSPLNRLQSSIAGQSFSVLDMRKVGQAQPSKPVVPELCLEHIWTENVNTK